MVSILSHCKTIPHTNAILLKDKKQGFATPNQRFFSKFAVYGA